MKTQIDQDDQEATPAELRAVAFTAVSVFGFTLSLFLLAIYLLIA